MARGWGSIGIRAGGVTVGAAALALALSGCQQLATTVTSVTGTYGPYNPSLTDEGVPTEVVDFSVSGYTGATLVCLVEVFDGSGQMVGNTVATLNQGSASAESIPVDVTGAIFDGGPSDAVVRCGTR